MTILTVAVCTVCMAQIKLSRVGVAGFCRNKANLSLAELDKIKSWEIVDKVKRCHGVALKLSLSDQW